MASDTDKIFTQFKEHSVAEFFKKNKQMLGFSGKTRSLTIIVHEYITNSIDACEEAGILPEISVKVDELDKERYRVTVTDNGPGIPKKHLGKALGQMLAGTKFHRYAQQRGQQGIGAAGCTMYAQVTTGKPVKVVSEYDSKRVKCEISVDLKTNSPLISNEVIEENPDKKHGVWVSGEFAECKYDRSSAGVYEYVKRTALANPHVTLTLVEPSGEKVVYPRSHEVVPRKPMEVQPHPLGLTTSDIMDMAHRETSCASISGFLKERFQRISDAKVKELQELLDGKTSGLVAVDFGKKPKDMTWAEAEALVKAFTYKRPGSEEPAIKFIAPASDCIRPIGAEQIEKSLQHILAPDFVAVSDRSTKIYKGGVPFLVEAALSWGGQSGRRMGDTVGGDVIRFANAAPLLFDTSGCAITQAVKDVDWKRYNIRDFEQDPLTVFVNLASVHVPYTSAGKQAISDEEEVYMEIKNAVMEAARKLQLHLSGIRREADRTERRKAVLRYVKQLSKDLTDLADKGKPDELAARLTHLIETKYMGQIMEGENDASAQEPEAKKKGKGKSRKEDEDEDEE